MKLICRHYITFALGKFIALKSNHVIPTPSLYRVSPSVEVGFFMLSRKFYFKNQGTFWNKSQKIITTILLCIEVAYIIAQFVRKQEHFVPKTGGFVPLGKNHIILLAFYPFNLLPI